MKKMNPFASKAAKGAKPAKGAPKFNAKPAKAAKPFKKGGAVDKTVKYTKGGMY
jgi:hypothetical protein